MPHNLGIRVVAAAGGGGGGRGSPGNFSFSDISKSFELIVAVTSSKI